MGTTFAVLAVTVLLFVWGRIRPDLVALASMLALHLTGVLTDKQVVAGFGNPGVVLIAVLFVVGAGLTRSGVTGWVAQRILRHAGDSASAALALTTTATATLSGFISNTGTVATLMPAVGATAKGLNRPTAHFLMPLAFAANAGGLLTLTGTPPNVIVVRALEEHGLEGFGFFEFAWIGLPLAAITIAYLTVVAPRLLPAHDGEGLELPSPDTSAPDPRRATLAILALVGMVVLMVTGVVKAVIAALLAACFLVVTGCLTAPEAYRSVSWSSVVLIAAMVPMSTALETTGGAAFLAGHIADALGPYGPHAVLAGLFLLTTALSQVVNNTATAVLMAPIVFATAQDLGVSPEPLLISVCVSASAAFLTPIGTSTNVLVFEAGGYRFMDYLKLGTPLNLAFLVVTTLWVPVVWPF